MDSVVMSRKVELWPVKKLNPYKKNSRTHSPEQVDQIANAITEFGFTNPILVDSESGIIAGHGRLLAAKKLKLKDVPVIVLDHLTEAQKRAYVIADNKLALNAGWDEALLQEEIGDLLAEDFDIDLLGFSDDELQDLMTDDWDSDIEKVEKVEKNTSGLTAVIKIECPEESKTELREFIREAISQTGFEGVYVA